MKGHWTVEVDPQLDALRIRDDAALAKVLGFARAGGVLEQLAGMPPATVDRLAAAVGWQPGPTRAVLQGLSASGRVSFDADLATWSLLAGADQDAPAAPAADPLPELTRAIFCPERAPLPALDRPPFEVLERCVLPCTPDLQRALERSASVVLLPGSEVVRGGLVERFPRSVVQRGGDVRAIRNADLILQLSPLALPPSPERWLARVARGLSPGGHLILRTLSAPLQPPEPARTEGRGWWHALTLAQALQGGGGRAWSEPLARCAARATGCLQPTGFSSPVDPACVHLVMRQGSSTGIPRSR